jgi:hypothetical protein
VVRRSKFDKAANKYHYSERVDMEWFGHDLDLDGSKYDSKEED